MSMRIFRNMRDYVQGLCMIPAMITADEIRALMAARGWNQTQMGAAVNVAQGTVSRWLAGSIPDPEQQSAILALIRDEGLAANRQPVIVTGPTDMPVYASVEGGKGELVVSTDPIDLVPRPWYLGRVAGYGVKVVGESMSPAFQPGDIAIVNPKIGYQRDKVHIFTQENENGEFIATIKLLKAWDKTSWKLLQYNPPSGEDRDFSLPRTIWVRALRVVGKYDGG